WPIDDEHQLHAYLTTFEHAKVKELEADVELPRPVCQQAPVGRVLQNGIAVTVLAQHACFGMIFVQDEVGAHDDPLLLMEWDLHPRQLRSERSEREVEVENTNPKHNPLVRLRKLAHVDDGESLLLRKLTKLPTLAQLVVELRIAKALSCWVFFRAPTEWTEKRGRSCMARADICLGPAKIANTHEVVEDELAELVLHPLPHSQFRR